MKFSKEDAEKMDQVLLYLIRNDKARVKSKQVQDILGVEFEKANQIYHAILKYNNEVEPVAGIMHASNLAARPGVTEEFIKKGGFLSVFQRQLELDSLKNSEFEKNGLKQSNENRKMIITVVILSVLAIVIASISLLFSLHVLKLP